MHLTPHPDTPGAFVRSVDAAVWEDGDCWHFLFRVEGAARLIVPDPAEARRTDGLWKTTCFEAFVAVDGDAYLEFNFSPSGQWAAYRFNAPRQSMRDEPAEVELWLEGGEPWIVVEAAVRSATLAPGAALNLTAVIEEQDGVKSYWALAHPAGALDFHDRGCFTATLADIAPS